MPVGLGSQGASIHVSRLRVLRDIYYIANVGGSPMTDYRSLGLPNEESLHPLTISGRIQEIFRTPTAWATTKLFDQRGAEEFSLAADQFFPLGDNSPASKDGRLWEGEKYVERRFLTGKALFIYWPHSWDWPIPFWPNFRRMGYVR
jgi:signal peptidase I